METYEEGNSLEHIGIARRSGRYPWGSGKDPLQRSKDFKSYMEEMKSQGLSEAQIAEGLSGVGSDGHYYKVTTSDLRAATAISTEHIFAENQSRANYLKNERGMSTSAVARDMGVNESTVRGWLKKSEEIKESSLRATSGTLKDAVDRVGYLDVGKGTELYLGVTDSKLRSSLAMLKDQDYEVWNIKVPQLGAGSDKMTEMKVLAKPGSTWKDARDAVVQDRIRNITDYSDDGGVTYKKPSVVPKSLDLKRVAVRYDEDGGTTMDGVIELRRGVADLDLGAARYAQVRVAVDGTHYLKGMAMYADDLPAGVDVRFNTNKSNTGNKLDAMKPMKTDKDGKVDPDNPFGASTYPQMYKDRSGKDKQSSLNIVGTEGRGNIEGRWDQWSRSLSSQMLSKQSVKLAAEQLGEARKTREEELESIKSLTNPVVRQKLLLEYAEAADSAAVHLKGAAMPRQSSHVLLPMNTVRPNEIYAPNFKDGERVVLVRYPHGGPFEIPELKVNNRNAQAKRIMGNARDAVGIHHTVANQLSGADFDGDAVLVIPNDSGKIKIKKPLKDLEGFEPKAAYPEYDGMVRMSKKQTQTEMGKISNLITDMTIKGADDSELARAVKHSMVVIDAEKHKLNFRQSELDNGIKQLKVKYQGGARAGASTIISKASSDQRVPQRSLRKAKDGGPVDPKTGRLVYEDTGASYVNASGKTVVKKTKGTKMEFVSDARKLSSGEPMEELYAAHANAMKGLANEARKVAVNTKRPKQSPAAKAVYSEELKSLDSKLKIAQRNAPLERRAQVIGNATAKAKIDAHPDWESDDIKKAKYQSLEDARIQTGAQKNRVVITDREWEAIQAGAVSSSKLSEILTHSDMDRVKELAAPRRRTSLTPGQMARAKQMAARNVPMSEIAETLGIPRSTIIDNLGV